MGLSFQRYPNRPFLRAAGTLALPQGILQAMEIAIEEAFDLGLAYGMHREQQSLLFPLLRDWQF